MFIIANVNLYLAIIAAAADILLRTTFALMTIEVWCAPYDKGNTITLHGNSLEFITLWLFPKDFLFIDIFSYFGKDRKDKS